MLKIEVRHYTCTDANGHFKAYEGIKMVEVIHSKESAQAFSKNDDDWLVA